MWFYVYLSLDQSMMVNYYYTSKISSQTRHGRPKDLQKSSVVRCFEFIHKNSLVFMKNIIFYNRNHVYEFLVNQM